MNLKIKGNDKLFLEKSRILSEFGIEVDSRSIHVSGVLTEDFGTSMRIKIGILKNWWEYVMEEKMSDITLEIASLGGSIYSIGACLDIYDELLEGGTLVNTKAQGICMSAATVLLAGGTGERTSTKRCKIMLHDMQIEGVGGTANQIQHTAKTISNEQMELFSLYAQFSRKGKEPFSEKDLQKESKKWHKQFTKDSNDHYITAEEALNLNLIDRILN